MRLALLLALPLALAASASAQGLRHAHPERDAQVPVDGWPTWAEDLTVGTPVADFGSHAGLKAAVTTDGGVPARALLNAAHYGAFGTVAAQTDQTLVWFVDLATGAPALAPPDDRRVTFHPWGWEETARQGDLRAWAAATTVATDAFLLLVRVENHGVRPRVLGPRLGVIADGDAHESMHPLHLSWFGTRRAALDPASGGALLEVQRGGPLDAFAWDRLRLARAVAADVPLLAVRAGLGPFPTGGRWARTLEAAPLALAPGAARTLAFVVGCGEDAAEARRSLARGRLVVGPDAPAALAARRAAWDRDLAALPPPHTADPDEARLYRIAHVGLRMNRFARRGAMSGACATAAKVHFNQFFVWDTALHVWAEQEWDPALAREELTTLLRAQQPEGHLHYAVGPDLRPTVGLIRGTSQPPIHGWVVERLLDRGGADPAWLAEVYDRSARWLAWFDRERDRDGDGLPGYASALETGWDDTPRYPTLHPAPVVRLFGLEVHLGNLSGLIPVDDVDALDLACWRVAYDRAMARLAEALGRPAAEVDGWRARAAALAARVDARLWDPVTQSYRDARVGSNGAATAVRVDTPVVAWPLFLGVCRDLGRARATIERHLLDPARFYGDPDDPARPFFPVPSVAYDDPAYDRAADGYYWRGQAWLLPAFATCEALFKYGWEAEARELRRRVLRAVLRAHGNGIHETYDARSDRIGFGSGSLTGAGEPAAFLIGLSCAPVVELLLDRHERERLVTARDAGFEGFVAEARVLETDALVYRAAAVGGAVPRVRLRARGGAPLRPAPGAPAPALELTLEDPYGARPAGPVAVELPGLAGYGAWGVDAAGAATRLPAGPGPGLTLALPLTAGPGAGPYARYVLVPGGGAP